MMRHVRVTAKPECWDLFTTPTMMGAVVDEDETHIWIGNFVNRYPKWMVTIEEVSDKG